MAVVRVETRTEWFWGNLIAGTVLLFGLFSLGSCVVHIFGRPDNALASAAAPVAAVSSATTPPRRAPIGHEAFEPYLRREDLIMWRQYGARGVAQINHLRVLAAKRASVELTACDEIETSDLNDARSSPPSHPVITVVCGNMAQASYSKSELLGVTPSSTR